MTNPQFLAFLTAGRATFTLKSKKSGLHFTYRVRAGRPMGTRPPELFVSVLVSAENYAYMGVLRAGALRGTQGSKISRNDTRWVAFEYFLRALARPELPPALEFRHAGCCGRCGRELTTPESIDRGLGPECALRAGPGA